MATLEKPKQKKNKHTVPSKSKTKQRTTECSEEFDDAAVETDKNKEITLETEASSSQPKEQIVEVTKNEDICADSTSQDKENDEINNAQEILKPLEDETINDVICDTKSDVNIKVLIPSAPVEHKTIENVKYPELPVRELSQTIQNLESVESPQKEFIKPFTVSQLSALYNNPELCASKQFISQFVDSELRAVNSNKHVLYELLMSYLYSREKLQENSVELSQLKTEYISCQNLVWNIEIAKISEKAQCSDGTTLTAKHEYQFANLQRNRYDDLVKLQNRVKIQANEVYTLHAYTTCLLKLKIEHYINTVVQSSQAAFGLTNTRSDHPITLQPSSQSPHLQELRLCISVLFQCQRRVYKDREFVLETRAWLTDLVALLLRAADWQDHHYLLNQVLRCPAGIGSWATSYIQVPTPNRGEDSPFSNKFVNHIVAILSVLLCPVEKRDAFLQQILISLQEPQDAVSENLWVLVDSDGEEDEDNSFGVSALKENDLVALLNQIPMADLFRSILLIQRQDERDIWTGLGDSHHILRLLSFCTVLIQLYAQGLAVYNIPRYHQFAKRLCRLVRQTLQYASDTWEIYRDKTETQYDKAMFERIQTEFDAFFLRATTCLFKAQKLGAWQFLAIAPFHSVSINTLWRFYYMLHQGISEEIDDFCTNIDYKNQLSDQSSMQHFCERLCIMSTEESYYLLNTFANMIMARSESDEDFIRFGTLNLLQIGFSGDGEAQESSCKCAAILLSNITSRYPALISDILSYVKIHINDLNQIMFLFSELPLHLWHPTDKDMDIISNWLLLNPITSLESYIARKILSNLHWGFAGNGALFLPLEMHQRVAVLCVIISSKDPSQQHQAFKWAWNLSLRLRLHATSRNTTSVNHIPVLASLQDLKKEPKAENALALYVALVMTDIGHLLPLVCEEGLMCLLFLALVQKYDAVLVALYYITPLFLDCTDNLLMCSYFSQILITLLQADRTYIKMAKNIISSDFPGPTLRNFANMIVLQIHNPMWHPLFEFWVKALISLPKWEQDATVLYLLNVIVRTAFFIPEKYRAIGDIFKDLLEKATEKKASSNSTLLSWVAQCSSNPVGSAIILGPGIGSSEPWLLYLIISLEHQQMEIKSGLWAELLRQLHSSSGKTNVDATLKKAANVVKVPSYTSSGLCVYRWAQLALDTDLSHPLLPLIWQRFFSLYLARVPPSSGAENCGSVGSKFFDGMVNTSFCKKLKKRLQETVEFYHRKLDPAQTETNGETNEIAQRHKELIQRLVKMFNAYVFWLEEPLLQESSLYVHSLPPQYEPRYLQHIIQGSTSPWLELINCDIIRNDFERCRNEWDTLCCIAKPVQRAPIQKMGGGEVKDPVERILRRLTSYDKPLQPPPLHNKAFVIPALNLRTGEAVSSALQPYIKKLQQFAEIYSLQVSEHAALDCQYDELIQQLYENFQTKITQKRTCNSSCTGAAVLYLKFSESRVNESIKHQMQINRTNFASLLSRTLQPPVQAMCLNCASLEYTADVLQRHLTDSLHLNDTMSEEQFRNLGVEFFYFILSTFNEELKAYPPTLQLFNTVLDKLGQGFLSGVEKESVRLVRTIFQQPKKGSLLSPHFIASNLSTNVFLQLYSDICENITKFPEISLALLSKFNVENWLVTKRPKLAERSKFIQLVFQSLTKLGPNPTKQQYSLHEIFRRHILVVFRHDFPEHYGEVLMLALQHSAAQTLAVIVWTDLLTVLSYPVSQNDAIFLRNHATRQKLLGARELADTVDLLSRYFSQERLQFGLYGLYPKYRPYIDPLCTLLGMTLHALVVATVEAQEGAALADTLLADHLWPRIIQAFGPWLVPYSVNDCKDSTATWIQQLTDDRAVLLPWIQADISSAKKLFNMFVDCIHFIGDTLPGCSHLFCYVWQFYSINFAHPTVKEHIWTVVHTSLISINWEQFWPTLSDLEMMLKIIDLYLPECHTFLGQVFLEINWPMWISRLTQGGNTVAITRAHHCLLHLLVKISREPSVRQADRARILIERSREFSWSVLDVNSLEQTLDWYVMSCDPRVALPLDPAVKQIDYIVFGLLRVVSCYDNTIQPINVVIVKKRQCFIRAYIKLIINCSSRNKQLLSDKPEQFCVALTNQLDHMELIIGSAQDQINQSTLLVSEFLQVLNNSLLCPVALKCIEQWLETRTSASEVLRALLKTTCNTVSSAECASTILEAAFTAYFTPSMSENTFTTWTNAVELFSTGPPRQPSFEQALVSSGRLLTLYALLLKKISTCQDRKDIESVLEMVVHWLNMVKVNDVVESKLPLLWSKIIELSLKVCYENNEEKAAICLRKLVNGHLLLVADNKNTNTSGGWGRGLLGAIGLSKQSSISQQCRFLCRALAGYILAQLPEPKGEPQKVRCFAGASGPVGQPGGNIDCAKVLLKLNSGSVELKPHLEQTLKQIQDPQNSLHNAEQFLFGLVNILYSKAYLKIH